MQYEKRQGPVDRSHDDRGRKRATSMITEYEVTRVIKIRSEKHTAEDPEWQKGKKEHSDEILN